MHEKTSETPLTMLCNEVETWKHNRNVYPGLLIASDSMRERIWDNTRGWIGTYLQERANLQVQQELELLFELNWRLETALIPIWDFLIPAYSHVLEAINPFPQFITDLSSATVVLKDDSALEADWASIRQQWLTLSFAILHITGKNVGMTPSKRTMRD